MKKLFMVLAATVVCGACLFTSCKKDKEVPDLNLSEKILGKWINTERNGEPMLTNKETVFTFISTTKALVSASRSSRSVINPEWMDRVDADVNISGNKVTVTFHPDEHTTSVHECNITDINGSEFTANEKVTVKFDGNVIISEERLARFEKATADYRQAVIGLWECTGLSGGETYNDANARLEFLDDGTYRYYRMDDGGQWQAVTTREFQDYFVDGTLLATRWKIKGEDELREWWEIESLSGNEMVWTALRQNADGSTFQQKTTWKKIDLKVAEKIIGKWVPADKDGQPMISDKKMVITFASTTKAYMSESLNSRPEAGAIWNEKMETAVSIVGNKVTVTFHRNEHHTGVHEYIITEINDNEFTANHKVTSTVDGNVVHIIEDVVRYTKVTADYSEEILGLWECEGLIGDETYNDGNDRLEFLSDGTYRYYRQDDNGQWQVVTNRELQDYFVDGTLLATRWKNQGEDELREWWEIASLADGQMQWTALRQNADGTTAQQGMTWKKIDLNVAEKIIGKWMTAESKGKPAVTNRKSVVTIVSATKAYISKSFDSRMESSDVWMTNEEADVVISGNKVTLTSYSDEHTTRVNEYIINDINDIEFTANVKLTKIVDGSVVLTRNNTTRLSKVTADYRENIVGTWQGHCTSEGSVFDDGQEHRWQYNADGTYVYYVKDGDNWVPYEGNTLNEYFVDGTLLCTRWIDQGQENREWWEITIDGSQMHWTALRQNPDGTTFTATFEMEKVN